MDSESTESVGSSVDLSELPVAERLEEEKILPDSDFVAFTDEEIDEMRLKGKFLEYDEPM